MEDKLMKDLHYETDLERSVKNIEESKRPELVVIDQYNRVKPIAVLVTKETRGRGIVVEAFHSGRYYLPGVCFRSNGKSYSAINDIWEIFGYDKREVWKKFKFEPEDLPSSGSLPWWRQRMSVPDSFGNRSEIPYYPTSNPNYSYEKSEAYFLENLVIRLVSGICEAMAQAQLKVSCLLWYLEVNLVGDSRGDPLNIGEVAWKVSEKYGIWFEKIRRNKKPLEIRIP